MFVSADALTRQIESDVEVARAQLREAALDPVSPLHSQP